MYQTPINFHSKERSTSRRGRSIQGKELFYKTGMTDSRFIQTVIQQGQPLGCTRSAFL